MPHIPGPPADDPMIIKEDDSIQFIFPDSDDDAPEPGLVSPGDVGSGYAPPSTDPNATDFQAEVLDLLRGELSDPDKPLGNNFQKTYEVETGRIDQESGLPIVDTVDAEEFLTQDKYQEARRKIFGTGKAFLNVYYQRDIAQQFNILEPRERIAIKNLLSDAGLLDLDKTYGTFLDNETIKGIKLAMDFTMNNQGQLSWVATTNALKNSAQAQRAYETNNFEFTDEVLKDYRDELLSGAETRKGAPLTDREKSIILSGIDEQVEQFDTSNLTAGTTEFLDYNPLTGETVLVPGTEAEEPDFEEFSEQGADILEQIFAPRESLAQASAQDDDTFVRMQRNLRGLKAAENRRTGRP